MTALAVGLHCGSKFVEGRSGAFRLDCVALDYFMRGLDPRLHLPPPYPPPLAGEGREGQDCRVTPGNDRGDST